MGQLNGLRLALVSPPRQMHGLVQTIGNTTNLGVNAATTLSLCSQHVIEHLWMTAEYMQIVIFWC
jgi:hypothetical protein